MKIEARAVAYDTLSTIEGDVATVTLSGEHLDLYAENVT